MSKIKGKVYNLDYGDEVDFCKEEKLTESSMK
jgi:hypothetical protein